MKFSVLKSVKIQYFYFVQSTNDEPSEDNASVLIERQFPINSLSTKENGEVTYYVGFVIMF